YIVLILLVSPPILLLFFFTSPTPLTSTLFPYTTLFRSYINRAMPFDKPGLLKPSEVYAVAAYILNLNGIIGEGDVMDAKTLRFRDRKSTRLNSSHEWISYAVFCLKKKKKQKKKKK